MNLPRTSRSSNCSCGRRSLVRRSGCRQFLGPTLLWRAPAPEPKCNFMAETDMSERPLHSYPPQTIAIVGLAGKFPDARSLDDFWRNIRAGRESLETFDDVDLATAG